MADYYVGPDADYATPQTAIDQLFNDVGTSDFTEENRIIITNGAAYEGYEVSQLNPTSTYRLIITAATSNKPIILAHRTNRPVVSAATIRSPYVTLERQEFRGGAVGVLIGSAASGWIGKQLMIRDPWRVGIAIRNADEILLFNSVIYAPNTCISAPSARSLSVFYSTLKNGQNQRFYDDTVIPATSLDPYPQASVLYLQKAEGDTGEIYIHDNNMVAINGPIYAVTERTIRFLSADYNNLCSPNQKVALFIPSFRQEPMNLEEWRIATSQEEHSIAEDPKFIQSEINVDQEDGIYQDLRLKKTSILRAKAENLSGESFPPYILKAQFTGDFNDLSRTQPNATIGAYELQGNLFNYWDEILPQSGEDPHGDTSGIFEIAQEYYASVVQPWYPKIRTGFFWAYDNLYYLYSDKQFNTLDQLRWYIFTFTGELIPDTVEASFEGTPLTDSQWDIHGQEFIFKSAGFEVTGDDMQLVVSGEQLIWSSGDDAFVTGDYIWTGEVGSGEELFVLDPAPSDGAPIVVTDTSITNGDSTGDLPYGYCINYNDDLDIVTITFQSGDLPEDRFIGAVTGDPYVLNDIIASFTWGAFAEYGDYLVNFPGLETWGMFTRSLDYSSLSHMTIEWEGSNSGVYEISDLSINPIHNQKTNGFLCIRNILSRQWDRTLVSGENTLEDNWKAGRTSSYLPWARITGKNKWRPLIREFSAPIPRQAAYVYQTGEVDVIDSTPGPLIVLQGSTGDEITFTVFDQDDNALAFQLVDFSLSSSDDNPTGEFAGYLAKREFGVYTKLGHAISNIETDTAGQITIRYLPMPKEMALLYTPDIVTGSTRYIETPYDIYPDNYGNPTIVDQWGDPVILTGDLISGEFTGEFSGEYYWYTLNQYPARDTVTIEDSGIKQEIVYHTDLQDGEAYVDIENKRVKSNSSGPLSISFRPVLAWRTPTDNNKIYLDDSLSLPDYFILGYDVWIKLIASSDEVTQTEDIICRNPYATGEQ